MLLILRIDIYVDLHVFAMSLCIDLFILQSKVTPNILIDLLCGITSVPTVSVMCLKGSGFVLNTVKSVLSWLISRELILIHSHTSVAFDSIVAVIISKTLKVYFYVPLRECPSASAPPRHRASCSRKVLANSED